MVGIEDAENSSALSIELLAFRRKQGGNRTRNLWIQD